MNHPKLNCPSILAPAGNKDSFLAALAAGADEIYCGLRQFSARMAARNLFLEELLPLTRLAHDQGTKVYVALNALLKPDELNSAGGLLKQLDRQVKPDGIIIQDPAFVQLARQTGYSGELHLSTLSNVSFPAALRLVKNKLRVDRIVLPRELNIDEIKTMAAACSEGLDLEIFVHGALCYGVSGRCYWSSYFGGKSGLRGRCVQPCRRVYVQGRNRERFFSCRDLSLDVLVKVLLKIPKLRAWKIEGRKKGPHYVFYTVKAYRMLRDQGRDPQAKKEALSLLSYSLGRTGTHYHFLPQRPQNPVDTQYQTGSGLFVGRVKGTPKNPFLNPAEDLLPNDRIRMGYEDESWHRIQRIGKFIPRGGRLALKPFSNKDLGKGVPVFLIDRKEKDLENLLSELEPKRIQTPQLNTAASAFVARQPKRYRKNKKTASNLYVFRKPFKTKIRNQSGLWLSDKSLKELHHRDWSRIWWWIPPVIWPSDEPKAKERIDFVLKKGARNFVLNAPWQTAFFGRLKGMNLWAGPFVNIANELALNTLASLGYSGAVITPELGRKEYLQLPKNSPLPLGIVISGSWPLCISRIFSDRLETDIPFTSPKGEAAWAKKIDSDYWVYPNWGLDLTAKQHELEKAGYVLFVHLIEPIPKDVKLKKRPGLWNWDLELL